jgi:aconitase A
MISPEFSFISSILVCPYATLIPNSSWLLSALAILTVLSFARKVTVGKRVYSIEIYDVLMLLLVTSVLLAGVILGGSNYGQGSSREHAAMVPQYLGIKAVIAKSFARIHVANLINFGIVPFTLKCEEDYDRIDEGDDILIEGLAAAVEGKDSVLLKNVTKGIDIPLDLSLTSRQRDILLAGGLLNYTKSSI